MFGSDINKRFDEFIGTLVVKGDSMFHLEENMDTDREQNKAKVTVKLSNPALLWQHVDKHSIDYFQQQECADFMILEQRADVESLKWVLHIFEFKRSVRCGVKSWPDKISSQFSGAHLNALCYAGYLGITIDEVVVYTCHRFNQIDGESADPAALRLAAQHPSSKSSQDMLAWKQGSATLRTAFGNLTVAHKPLQVNEDFCLEYAL